MASCKTVSTVVLFCLHLCLLADHVLGQRQSPDQGLTTNDTFDSGHNEGSGDGDLYTANTTVFPGMAQIDTLPHLVVKDALGSPCLLATLNATMQVFYRVPEGIVHETYIAFAEIQLPEDVHAQGVCGENRTRLLLDWGNGTFHVNITFSRNERTRKEENVTWSLSDMVISYDLSNKIVFPGSSETDTVTVERQHLNLFTTPVGFTHECNHGIKVLAGTNDRGVVVNFHDVKIASFGVTTYEFPSDVHVCTQEDEGGDEEEFLIPLIVSCCLCALVIIIVIGYVISRRVQSSREQSDYRKMP